MNSLPKFQEIKMNSVFCNNALHQYERIRSLCLSQECKQNSAQCYKCFRYFHVQCLDSIELEEIPKVLMELG